MHNSIWIEKTLVVHLRMVHEKRRDFECEQCLKQFGIKNNLTKHIRMVHEIQSYM